MVYVRTVFDFLDAGVSPWHAAAEAVRRLEAAGYARLEEHAPWALEKGGRYYVARNGSAVIAFRLPEGDLAGWRVALSHSDSPTWRVKNADVAQGDYVKLETEGYGGMIMSSWLDRPLTVAGRAVVRTSGGVASRLIYIDRDLLVIPSVAIHYQRNANDGRKWDPQVDLQPLYGPAGCRSLEDLIVGEASVCPRSDVLSWDLDLAVRQKAVAIGPGGEYFMSPRIDDLECAATTLQGFLEAAPLADAAPVWGMLDNEEVGSSSRQGAQSTFLSDVLHRILLSMDLPSQAWWTCAANSLVLSADNGHAVHPNAPEKSDPQNAPRMNGGVVIKYNASQKYTTDALSAALFQEICRRAEIPTQRLANRADMPGGSTLGNLQSHSFSAPMLDIGLAQLAMHSAVETAGTKDIGHMVRAAGAFYAAPLRCLSDGRFDLA